MLKMTYNTYNTPGSLKGTQPFNTLWLVLIKALEVRKLSHHCDWGYTTFFFFFFFCPLPSSLSTGIQCRSEPSWSFPGLKLCFDESIQPALIPLIPSWILNPPGPGCFLIHSGAIGILTRRTINWATVKLSPCKSTLAPNLKMISFGLKALDILRLLKLQAQLIKCILSLLSPKNSA